MQLNHQYKSDKSAWCVCHFVRARANWSQIAFVRLPFLTLRLNHYGNARQPTGHGRMCHCPLDHFTIRRVFILRQSFLVFRRLKIDCPPPTLFWLVAARTRKATKESKDGRALIAMETPVPLVQTIVNRGVVPADGHFINGTSCQALIRRHSLTNMGNCRALL